MLSSPAERASASVWSSLEGEALECGGVPGAAPVSPPSFEGSVVTALGGLCGAAALPPQIPLSPPSWEGKRAGLFLAVCRASRHKTSESGGLIGDFTFLCSFCIFQILALRMPYSIIRKGVITLKRILLKVM